jgi:hypothetical protein
MEKKQMSDFMIEQIEKDLIKEEKALEALLQFSEKSKETLKVEFATLQKYTDMLDTEVYHKHDIPINERVDNLALSIGANLLATQEIIKILYTLLK